MQSFGPFAAIRHHHEGARITLLTTAPYADWMRASPWFDEVRVDERPAWWDLPGLLRLRRTLNDVRFDRVYDLQTSGRSSRYFRLLARPRPEWSGIARGCSHPDDDPGRNLRHDHERQARQLARAGIAPVPPPDLDWCRGDLSRFALPARMALLVPGSSPHRPAKRWPRFADLAPALVEAGLSPVVLGTAEQAPLAAAIGRAAPILDLTGRTSFGDLASLARRALVAIGNDTGPMHLLAAIGVPSVVLFSANSDPALCAPRGRRVVVLGRRSLAELKLAPVIDAARDLLALARV